MNRIVESCISWRDRKMTLEEFMETDIYKDAGYYNYVDLNGEEIEEDENDMLDKVVRDYYKFSGGCLEITLDI